jgi:hypothetical protein
MRRAGARLLGGDPLPLSDSKCVAAMLTGQRAYGVLCWIYKIPPYFAVPNYQSRTIEKKKR